MRYLGGKSRIAKDISDYINSVIENRDFIRQLPSGLNISPHGD